MQWVKKALREPLLHFLILGGCIFLAEAEWVKPSQYLIKLNDDTLVEFMQFRAQSSDQSAMRQQLNSMSAAEKQRLQDDYVKEEVLYREAKALGLDQGDYIIRRRLVQKTIYISESVVRVNTQPTKQQIMDFYQQHLSDYEVPAKISFTHIFYPQGQNSSAAKIQNLKQQLIREKSQINQQNVAFEQAALYGEPVFMPRNFILKDAKYVASHFGKAFTEVLFDAANKQPSNQSQVWLGPFSSAYGQHLVLVNRYVKPQQATLTEVKPLVEFDLKSALVGASKVRAIEALVQKYQVQQTPNKQ